MISSKRALLKPLLESADGPHLTVYLKNEGDAVKIRAHLRRALLKAEALCAGHMSVEEKIRFLEPLKMLERDERLLTQLKGHLGLFRTAKMFRMVRLTVPVKPQCVLSCTFHIKPLLSWIQSDREFLILEVGDREAHLYKANLAEVRRFDTLCYPESDAGNSSGVARAIGRWVRHRSQGQRPKLFMFGEPLLVKILSGQIKYPSVPIVIPTAKNKLMGLTQVHERTCKVMMQNDDLKIQESLDEYDQAVEQDLASHSLLQIAKAAVNGRVKKLIISEADLIFGKLDRVTGAVQLHPKGLVGHGDDVLDDLAQLVLLKGGDVILVGESWSRPNGEPPARAIFRKSSKAETESSSLKRRDSQWTFASKI